MAMMLVDKRLGQPLMFHIVELLSERKDGPLLDAAFFADPEGNIVGLSRRLRARSTSGSDRPAGLRGGQDT